MTQSLMLSRLRAQPAFQPASFPPRAAAKAQPRGMVAWAPARLAPRTACAPRAAKAPGEAPLFDGLGARLQRAAKEVGTPAASDWAGRMRSAVARYLQAERGLQHSLTRQLPDEPAQRRAVLETLRVMQNMCDAADHRVPHELVGALQRGGHWEALQKAMRLRHTEILRPAQFTAPELRPARTHSALVDALRARVEDLRTEAESLVLRQWCSTVCQRMVTYIEYEATYAANPRSPGNLALLRAATADLSFMLVVINDTRAQKVLGWEDLAKDADLVALLRATRCALDARRLELQPEWAERTE